MKLKYLAGTTAFLALTAGSLHADVTPEEIWQKFQQTASAQQQKLETASVAREGDTLVVSGLTLSTTAPDTGADARLAMDRLNFREVGDGSVEITMSDSYTFEIAAPNPDDPAKPFTNLGMKASQPGFTVIASGTPEATAYTFAAPSMEIALVSINGAPAETLGAGATATLTGLSGTSTIAEIAGEAKIDTAFTLESLAFTGKGADAAAKTSFDLALSAASLAGNTTGNINMAQAAADLALALANDGAINGTFRHGAMNFTLNGTDASGPVTVTGAAAGGDLNAGIGGGSVSYGTTSKGLALSIKSPAIPVPEVKLNYDELAFNLLMPFAKTEAPADFALLTRIIGLKLSDEVWNLFDPAQSLPRDPATLIIDTKGKVSLAANLANEAELAALGTRQPVQIEALDVTELRAEIAGAALKAAGAVTFDNTDTTTFPGIPLPTGKLDINLIGANALMDKLVTLGLLSADDVTGARFMMSLFANAGPGPDELNSTLEFKDKGFFANGQQLQ